MNEGLDSIVAVLDNGGESFDRYTVIYLQQPYTRNGEAITSPSGAHYYDFLAMSKNPFHPQGFGQHGEIQIFSDDIKSMRNKMIVPDVLYHIGERISFSSLPKDCKIAVKNDLGIES